LSCFVRHGPPAPDSPPSRAFPGSSACIKACTKSSPASILRSARRFLTLPDKMFHQGADVFWPITQGRNLKHQHIQPVVQVRPGIHPSAPSAKGCGAWPLTPAHSPALRCLRQAIRRGSPEVRVTACLAVRGRGPPIFVEKQHPRHPLARINPLRRCSAPVKAPRRCPNSSLSARPLFKAEQFSATNGPLFLLGSSW